MPHVGQQTSFRQRQRLHHHVPARSLQQRLNQCKIDDRVAGLVGDTSQHAPGDGIDYVHRQSRTGNPKSFEPGPTEFRIQRRGAPVIPLTSCGQHGSPAPKRPGIKTKPFETDIQCRQEQVLALRLPVGRMQQGQLDRTIQVQIQNSLFIQRQVTAPFRIGYIPRVAIGVPVRVSRLAVHTMHQFLTGRIIGRHGRMIGREGIVHPGFRIDVDRRVDLIPARVIQFLTDQHLRVRIRLAAIKAAMTTGTGHGHETTHQHGCDCSRNGSRAIRRGPSTWQASSTEATIHSPLPGQGRFGFRNSPRRASIAGYAGTSGIPSPNQAGSGSGRPAASFQKAVDRQNSPQTGSILRELPIAASLRPARPDFDDFRDSAGCS